jgi:hypothetical protein
VVEASVEQDWDLSRCPPEREGTRLLSSVLMSSVVVVLVVVVEAEVEESYSDEL